MHRDAGKWRHGEGIVPSALSKEWQRERKCLFIIGVGAGKFLGCEGFFPNFPKLARKVFCETFADIFSPTEIMKTYFRRNLQNKVFMCFYANLGHHFLKSINVGRNLYPDFLFVKLLIRFSANQNFWGCACNPCIPISNTTAFHDSITGNFMVCQDRLETNLLRLFRHPENSE